jgi:hypothetical protein
MDHNVRSDSPTIEDEAPAFVDRTAQPRFDRAKRK